MKINKIDLKAIDKRSYIRLKLLLNVSMTLFLLFLLVMLINFTVEYETNIDTVKAFLSGLIYIPFLLLSTMLYIIFQRKLKAVYCDEIKVRTGKQKIGIGIVKSLVIVFMIFIMLLVLLPYAALPMFVNRHVNYQGYATEQFPLQDIYQAEDFQLKEKQMYLTTKDGLKLWASEIDAEHPKAVIIYLCSICQPSVTYYYGQAKFMEDHEYSSILLEVRGHGKSDGNRICLGYDEVNDVQAAVDYIKQQDKYDNIPIVVQGVSMGGAVAVNAFGQIKEIDALIAMSAYSSFEDVVLDEMKGIGVPGFIRSIELPLIRSSLSMIYGSYKVNHIKPEEQIGNANGRPVLLMANQMDKEVPPINMQRLKEADPEAEAWLRNSWEHFIIKNCDFKNVAEDKEYCNKILDFIENKVLIK